jgi:hypothetical protein
MKISHHLSILILFLTSIATIGGLTINILYRDNEFYKLLWQTNDWVSLALVMPLLATSLYFSKKGAVRAQLLWMGLLAYLFYNYAFYLFGAAFNWFFLLYAAIMALSLYALVIGLWHLDVPGIGRFFNPKTPVKWIAVFLVLMALPLAIVEIGQCLQFIATGELPISPTLIFALDLTFIIPNMLLAAVLLWRRNAWGYVIGAIMLVKGITYGAVLSLSATRLALSDMPEKDKLLPFYLFVLIGSLLFFQVLLKHLKQPSINELSHD